MSASPHSWQRFCRSSDDKVYDKDYVALQETQKRVSRNLNGTLYVPTDVYAVPSARKTDRYDADFHYYGRADHFVRSGRAFGRGVLELLGWNRASPGAFNASHGDMV